MYWAEQSVQRNLEFSGGFFLFLMGAPMQTYHVERMRRLHDLGWLNMHKETRGWCYQLTDAARGALRQHVEQAMKRVSIIVDKTPLL